nr:unnamed protein product [Digitaria exilis]
MSLTSVKIGEEVWLTCLSHALTTETEEVMGLLLGDVEPSSKGGGMTAVIWGASPQMRCERKKDRVEVNPELLAAAMTATIKKTTRVIGWYHSHPHITVLPSHVDVRTQGMFQLLDTGFVGLIFSCFSEDAQKVGKIQVIAFQSQGGQYRSPLPLAMVPVPVIDLESSRSSSDHSAFEGIELDTGDSRASKNSKAWGRSQDMDFYSHPDTNHTAKHQPRENAIVPYNPDNTQEASIDLYDSDMTPSIQEALHRSNMDISSNYGAFLLLIVKIPSFPHMGVFPPNSGAEYVRKEVQLIVLPTRHLLKLDTAMTSYCDMQRVLFEEEQSAYNQAMQQNSCLSPAITALQDRLKENELRVSMLITCIL